MNWRRSAQARRTLLALGGLVLLGWLAWQNLSDELLPALEETGGQTQRLETASSWQYDDNGRLAYRLVTPRAVEVETGSRYELEAPEATLHDEPGTPPWTLRADTGTLLDDGDTVRLQGTVIAARAAHDERGRLELHTDQLWIYPQRRRAQTDVASTLQELDDDGEARWTSQADEIDLDWDRRVLRQANRVRDRIEPRTDVR